MERQAAASKSTAHPIGLSGRSTAVKYQRHAKYRNNGGGQTSHRKVGWYSYGQQPPGGAPKRGWTRVYN